LLEILPAQRFTQIPLCYAKSRNKLKMPSFDKINQEEYTCPVTSKLRGMLEGSTGRAKHRGFEHNLTLDYMFGLYLEICPILGIDLLWENKSKVRHGSPSLDRVNNDKGYIMGNVQIISHRANSLKSNYLLIEWMKMKDYMTMCDGKPLVITEDYLLVRESSLDEHDQRHVRAALKRKQKIINISQDLDIPVKEIIKIARQLKMPF